MSVWLGSVGATHSTTLPSYPTTPLRDAGAPLGGGVDVGVAGQRGRDAHHHPTYLNLNPNRTLTSRGTPAHRSVDSKMPAWPGSVGATRSTTLPDTPETLP